MNFQMFGATLYENKDFTKTTLNSEAGVKALEWMIEMVEKGYAPLGVVALTATDFVNLGNAGKVVFGGPPWPVEQRQAHYDNKLIDYVAETVVMEVPHIKGTPAPPLYVSTPTICVFKGGEVEAATKFAAFYVNRENTIKKIEGTGRLSPRLSIPTTPGGNAEIAKNIILKNGATNFGVVSPFYSEIRSLLPIALQAAFMGVKTPKQALDDFAKDAEALWRK